MLTVNLNKVILEIQPELAEGVMKADLAREYFCWLIIRVLDQEIGENGGKINPKKIRKYLCEITERSPSMISRYLKNGTNIFWRFNKQKDALYLNSFTKVCMELKINNIYSYNVLYNLSLISENFDKCKDILVSSIASKTGKPVSNINIAERCGISDRTVRKYLKNTEDPKINISTRIQNFELLGKYNLCRDAIDNIYPYCKENKINPNRIRIREKDNQFWMLKQLPNSVINKTGRSPIKTKKKTLRIKAGYPKIEKNKRMYFYKDTECEGLEYVGVFTDSNNKLISGEISNTRIFINRNVK